MHDSWICGECRDYNCGEDTTCAYCDKPHDAVCMYCDPQPCTYVVVQGNGWRGGYLKRRTAPHSR